MIRRLSCGWGPVALAVCLLGSFGCDNGHSTDPAQLSPRSADPVPAAEKSIELVPVTMAQWRRKLAAYPPDIVVVDMWATWCTPCIERFPQMVAMHERFRDQGVRFVSMSLEDVNDALAIETAGSFLREVDAAFENYLMNENMLDAFEQLGLIGIPAVLIYDRSGAERYRLTGDDPNRQFGDEDVKAGILALLEEQPPP